MKKTNQIISIHLGVLLLYTLVFAVWMGTSDLGHYRPDPYKWLFFKLMQTIMMIGHGMTIIALATNQPSDKTEYSKAHWLSLLFMLLLGGSLCFALPEVFSS